MVESMRTRLLRIIAEIDEEASHAADKLSAAVSEADRQLKQFRNYHDRIVRLIETSETTDD